MLDVADSLSRLRGATLTPLAGAELEAYLREIRLIADELEGVVDRERAALVLGALRELVAATRGGA